MRNIILTLIMITSMSAFAKETVDKVFSPIKDQKGLTIESPGLSVTRDAPGVVTRYMSVMDSLTVEMCFAAGVTFTLDDPNSPELIQNAFLDDNKFFNLATFKNKKSVFVRLVEEIPKGKMWESSLRIIRESDDKTYLINLIGRPCPDTLAINSFPKVIYIKNKPESTSIGSSMMTPEDMIIDVTDGYPRKNLDDVRVVDMITSSGSNQVTFSIEVTPKMKISEKSVEFKFLDNFQTSKIESSTQFLQIHSQKASTARKKRVFRFSISVNVNKQYILDSRYLHLIYLNRSTKQYENIRIDVLKRFKWLKDLGEDL